MARVAPAFTAAEGECVFAVTADAVLARLKKQPAPDIVLLDSTLPGMEVEQLLALMRSEFPALPILLIADSITEEWRDRLAEGIVDDLLLRKNHATYWELRADRALRTRRLECELSALRESSIREAQCDRLTGVLNREALLAALFRETDRVQRSGGALSVILFDIDDFGHWNSRLGVSACDQILRQVVERSTHLLRSYDLIGRTGKDEFLICLPGCGKANALLLAERLRAEIFENPFRVNGETIRLSACFGIAQSQGRSPVVVLRDAEKALAQARIAGPESIECFAGCEADPPPVTFLSPTSGDELVAW